MKSVYVLAVALLASQSLFAKVVMKDVTPGSYVCNFKDGRDMDSFLIHVEQKKDGIVFGGQFLDGKVTDKCKGEQIEGAESAVTFENLKCDDKSIQFSHKNSITVGQRKVYGPSTWSTTLTFLEGRILKLENSIKSKSNKDKEINSITTDYCVLDEE